MKKERIIKICDNTLEWCWLVIIFFVPVLFSYWPLVYDRFGIIKTIFFISLVQLMLVFYVLKIFLANKISYRVNYKIFILIGILFLCGLISLFFSINPLRSFMGAYLRWQGFYLFIHYLLFLLLIIFNLKNYQQVKRIIVTILFSSSIITIYGLLQYLGLDIANWQKSVFNTGRIFSSIGQPNFLGHYLVLIIPLTIYFLIHIIKSNIIRFIIAILLFIQICSLFLTYSRAAWIAFAIEFWFFLLILFFIKNKKLLFIFIICTLLFILIIVYNINFFNLNKKPSEVSDTPNLSLYYIKYRLMEPFDLKAGSVQLRLFMWQSALEEINQMEFKRLLFGYGQESMHEIFVKYYRPEWGIYETINAFPDRSHNAILDIVLTTGFVGLFIILLFYYFIIKKLIKFIKLENNNTKKWLAITLLVILVGYFINNLFSFSMIDTYVYLYLVLAMIIFIICSNDKNKIIRLDFLRKSFMTLIYLVLIITSCIIVFLYNIKPLIADYYFMKAEKGEKINKDCQLILDNLNNTIRWNPYQTYYQRQYLRLGSSCLINEKNEEVKYKIKNNLENVILLIEEGEFDIKVCATIARMYALFGYYYSPEYYNLAEKEYIKLIKINPYFTRIYQDYIKMELWKKDYDQAIALTNRALDVVPDLTNPYLNEEHKNAIKTELIEFYYFLAKAYNYKEDWDKAVIYYEKALLLNPYYIEIYKALADVYYQQDDLNKAIWYNQRGMMFSPGDYNWSFRIALLFNEKGNKKEALNYANKALNINPENEEVINLIDSIK